MREDMIKLGDVPDALFEEFTAAVKPYHVGLFGVWYPNTELKLTYVGSGVLVTRSRLPYLLTAGHVWQELAHFEEIGLCIKETPHDTRIKPDDVEASVAYDQQDDPDWGPDIAFLKLSTGVVATIGPEKKYYPIDLDPTNPEVPKADEAGIIGVVGAPTIASSIGPQTAALYSGPWSGGIKNESYCMRDGLDYFDIGVDANSPELPELFRGISGGPAWQLFLYRSTPASPLVWKAPPQLIGIVLSESKRPIGGRRVIRCHGPRTIYVEGLRLVGIA